MTSEYEPIIERRPDALGKSTRLFPVRWGRPPDTTEELRAWINAHAAEDRGRPDETDLERRRRRLAELERRANVEHRSSSLLGVAMSSTPTDSEPARRIAGIALPYPPQDGSTASIGGAFKEQFAPGAFSAQAANGWRFGGHGAVELRFQHEQSFLLASMRSGSLELQDGDRALTYRATLPRIPYLTDLLEAGDLAGSSVGFTALEETWTPAETSDGYALRTVDSAILFEISIVGNPAFPGATASLTRSIGAPTQQRHVEADEVYEDELLDENYQSEVLLPSGARAVLTVDGALRTLELPDGRKVTMMGAGSMRTTTPTPRRAAPSPVFTTVATPRRQQPRQILVTPHEPMTLEQGRRELDERQTGWNRQRDRELTMKHYEHKQLEAERAVRAVRKLAGVR